MQPKSPALTTPAARSVPLTSPSRLLVLFAWLSLCALFVFWQTFPLSYGLDDLDQLAAVATMRSGHMPFYWFVIRTHNEHQVPMLRLLFWAATWISGIDAWAARIAVLLVHIGGAMACAILPSYVSKNRLAPGVAGP